MGVARASFLQSLIFLFQSVFLHLKLGNYEFIKRHTVMGAGTVVILSPLNAVAPKGPSPALSL